MYVIFRYDEKQTKSSAYVKIIANIIYFNLIIGILNNLYNYELSITKITDFATVI